MVLVIIMSPIIASSVTMRSVIVTTMAMATSTSIIAIIVIIIASTGGIKLSGYFGIGLYNYFVVPFPSAGNLYMVSHCYIVPYRVYSLCCYLHISHYDINCYIFILFFLFRGKGRWLRLLLWFRFTFTFLSSPTSCAFKWFG